MLVVQMLQRAMARPVFAERSEEVIVETPAFEPPDQEWSAVLKITLQAGRVVEWEMEQFVLSAPGRRPRTFSADAIERSSPALVTLLRAQAEEWLRLKVDGIERDSAP